MLSYFDYASQADLYEYNEGNDLSMGMGFYDYN